VTGVQTCALPISALKVGASTTQFNDRLDINSAYINYRDLQIALLAYEKDKGKSLSLSEVISDYTEIYPKNEDENVMINSRLKDYVDWFGMSEEVIRLKRDDMIEYLSHSDFFELHPSIEVKRIDSLTPGQIVELNNAMTGN
jgi:hypothetical protein